MRIFGSFILLLITVTSLGGQSASALLHQLRLLQNPQRVLYLAAHPDDENTRMIAWLANAQGARTAYLSLTRGDGGQNLIGTEMGAALGLLRTQELMQARALDGGDQFFSRAVDFGYSKNAEETFQNWDRETVLADVVRVIRQFRPHLIITRFPPDARGGHGHHTASAMLAIEAFDLAADPEAFSDQGLAPWQVRRLYWNHSQWWEPNLDSIAAADPSYSKLEVGDYLPTLGLSCNELASYSRSQHKSQGFGVAVARGKAFEYLKLLKGAPAAEGPFADLPQNWTDLGLKSWDKALQAAAKNFRAEAPHAMLPPLLKVLADWDQLEGEQKEHYAWWRAALEDLIMSALGLKVDLLAPEEYAVAGEEMGWRWRLIQRSPLKVSYHREGQWRPLPENELIEWEQQAVIPASAASQPYWLRDDYQAMFKVAQPEWIGRPENGPAFAQKLKLRIQNQELLLSVPARYLFSDRVEGEISRPLRVLPPLCLENPGSQLVFVDQEPQRLILDFRTFAPGRYTLSFAAENWQVEPARETFTFARKGEKQRISLRIKPGAQAQRSELEIRSLDSGEEIQGLVEIDYPHIDKRAFLKPSDLRLLPLALEKHGERIAYLPGAGDAVPAALEQMGYRVDLIDEALLRSGNLNDYDALVLGIRAFNTLEWLPAYQDQMHQYVAQGGLMLVQYNTASRDLRTDNLGPYPFKLSRKRVTEEAAPARFVLPQHPVLQRPNRLSAADFDHWVQERGLYFAAEWDSAYAAPLGWQDQGEEEQLGALIIAPYGQGHYVYTGISFFRQLPAGVPGAYRLLANILSLNQPSDE